MNRLLHLCLLLLLVAPRLCPADDFFRSQELPELPEPLGVGGPFVGVSNGKLVVAGGAHFPVSPLEGGQKLWTSRAYALDPGARQWTEIGPLPRPLAYGVSITTEDGILLIGGSDAARHYADVIRVRLEGDTLVSEPLQPLPVPLANMGGALLGSVVYIAGGQRAPGSTSAEHVFLALDLTQSDPQWQQLEPWPGPARIFPVAAAQDGAFYLISGAELIAGADGSPTRRFLADGYRFHPEEGWWPISAAPHPMVAAPAAAWGGSHIFIFGGDDGSNFFRNAELGDSHPGFPRSVWAYHTITDTWTPMGETPFGHVTTSAVRWQDAIVIPSGEDRPGHRSPKVFLESAVERQSRFQPLDYLFLGLYLCSLVAMGIFISRKGKTTDDFFLAGRRIPWWAAGLSIYGTQLSSISFIATPAKVYATDWVYLLVQLSIILIAVPVVFVYLPFFRRTKLTSAYEYLERRFNVGVRLFASASFVLYQFGRMAIVLLLPAMALSTVTGINVHLCILVMGVLATVYTVLGGIEAVIWTDVIQVVVLLGGAFLSLALILAELDGGLAGLIASGSEASKFHVFNWSWDHTTASVWVVLVGNLFNNLVPYTSDQAVIQRYLTTKDEQAAARGIWMNAVMLVPSTLVLFTLGTALWAFYRANPELLDPSQATDSIFPLFMAQQLPVGIAGLVIAGVFAASMSTLDSSLNSVATALTTDWYARFHPDAPDHSKLVLARWLTAILGVLATSISLVLATFNVGSLWDTFQASMGLFGGGLAGLFALGILTRRANGRGALVGAAASVLVLAWVQRNSDAHFFLYGMVGVTSCFVIGYLSSFFFPKTDRDLTGLSVHTKAAIAEQ